MESKKLYILLFLAIFTMGGTFAYVQTQYNLSTQVEETVSIGNTTITEDGIAVNLVSYDNYNLTYFDITETSTDKHYLTYSYDYTVIAGYDVNVRSATDDIVITNVIYGDTIDITFSLNQTKDFNEGDMVSIQFVFELVQGININTATYEQLIALGFDDREATEIAGFNTDIYSLDELYNYIYIADIHARFDQYVNDGTIVFE
jgi:hypothetical protein